MTNSTFSGNLPAAAVSIQQQRHGAFGGNVFAPATGENCTNIDAIADNGYNLSDDATCTNGGTGSAKTPR